MAATVAERTGLEAFLPRVPTTPPIAPKQRETPANTKKNTRRMRAAAMRSTPAPVPQPALQEPVAGETQETRRAKTVRMGQARMVNALRAVRLLGNLSSRNYEWQDGEVALMRQTLMTAVSDTFAKFEKTRERNKLEDTFRLEGLNTTGH